MDESPTTDPAESTPLNPTTAPSNWKARLKKHRSSIAATGALLIVGSCFLYFRYQATHPSTEDAYIDAPMVTISSEVPGEVTHIFVHNQAQIQAQQPLFSLDPRPYMDALQDAQGTLMLQQAIVKRAQAAYQASYSGLQSAQSAYDFALVSEHRTRPLVQQGVESLQTGDQSETNVQEAAAALSSAHAKLQAAEQEYKAQKAAEWVDEAAVNLAQYHLKHTLIRAPSAGTLAELTLEPGDHVTTGQPLFYIVNLHAAWINAYFKEDDITHIQPGDRAEISLDLYPSKSFIGTVESISPASSNTFSLLPAENASGNWVKVPQRFEVKIMISSKIRSMLPPLRMGASANVRVNTESTSLNSQHPINATEP